MIETPFRPKRYTRALLYLGLVAASLALLYLSFIFILFVRIGLQNQSQQGFWLPIIIGASLLCLVVALFYKLGRFLFFHRKPNSDY